jgi:hypothetical protein
VVRKHAHDFVVVVQEQKHLFFLHKVGSAAFFPKSEQGLRPFSIFGDPVQRTPPPGEFLMPVRAHDDDVR